MHLKSVGVVFVFVAVATVKAVPEGGQPVPVVTSAPVSWRETDSGAQKAQGAAEKAVRWLGSWIERDVDIRKANPMGDEDGDHENDPSWGRRGIESSNVFDDGDHNDDPSWGKRDLELSPATWAEICDTLLAKQATGAVASSEAVICNEECPVKRDDDTPVSARCIECQTIVDPANHFAARDVGTCNKDCPSAVQVKRDEDVPLGGSLTCSICTTARLDPESMSEAEIETCTKACPPGRMAKRQETCNECTELRKFPEAMALRAVQFCDEKCPTKREEPPQGLINAVGVALCSACNLHRAAGNLMPDENAFCAHRCDSHNDAPPEGCDSCHLAGRQNKLSPEGKLLCDNACPQPEIQKRASSPGCDRCHLARQEGVLDLEGQQLCNKVCPEFESQSRTEKRNLPCSLCGIAKMRRDVTSPSTLLWCEEKCITRDKRQAPVLPVMGFATAVAGGNPLVSSPVLNNAAGALSTPSPPPPPSTPTMFWAQTVPGQYPTASVTAVPGVAPAGQTNAQSGSTASTPGGVCAGPGSNCIGDVTHYDAGMGACGWNVAATDMAVAMPVGLMGAQSNGNPYCGRSIIIKNPTSGATAVGKISDKCTGCAGYNIDLTDALFNAIAPGCDGRCKGFQWWFS